MDLETLLATYEISQFQLKFNCFFYLIEQSLSLRDRKTFVSSANNIN